MIDIVKTLEQLGLFKEAAQLKLAADQPDLFDENATQNIPEPVSEADRERIFREQSFTRPESEDTYWAQRESLLRKHLYKLWLDNLKHRSSQELYDEVMAIPGEKLQREWEAAQQKYPHERIEPEDSRQMALPMEQEPEIIVGPSPRQVDEIHRSVSGDINQLKPLLKEFAVYYDQKNYGSLIEACIRNPKEGYLNRNIAAFIHKAQESQQPEDPLREIVAKILDLFPGNGFFATPALKINAAFATPVVDHSVPKELYQEGLKSIRQKIYECNKLKAATHELLSRDGGQIYADPGSIDELSTMKQIEDWYSQFCLFKTEQIVRENVGDKVFGSSRFANRGFGQHYSYFTTGPYRQWFDHPEEFVKWISSADYKSQSISALGGMSAEVWITLKLKELEEYQFSLDTTYRALKSDFSWLKKNKEEFVGFSGTEGEVAVLDKYIDIVKSQFKDGNDLEKFLEGRVTSFNKLELLDAIFANYKARISAARGQISQEIFSPVSDEFAKTIQNEYLEWRTGLSSPDETLTLEKIYFAAERLAQVDKSKDYASAWNYPKFSPWPKESHEIMAESAKRRIGVAAISHFDTVADSLPQILFSLWKEMGNSPIFDGRSRAEVLASMLKHKADIFKILDERLPLKKSFSQVNMYESAIEKPIQDSVKLAYPVLTSKDRFERNNIPEEMETLYNPRFAIGTDISPHLKGADKVYLPYEEGKSYGAFDNILDAEKKAELKKLHIECTYGKFANVFLHFAGGVGPRAVKRKIMSLKESEDISALLPEVSDETISALGNIAISHFKDIASRYVEFSKSNTDDSDAHFAGDPRPPGSDLMSNLIAGKGKIPHFHYISDLNKIKLKIISNYKITDESTLAKLAEVKIDNEHQVNVSIADLEKALNVASPDTAEKAIEMLSNIVVFAGWIHNNGLNLDTKALQTIWKNPNRKSLLAGDNELIKNYFKLFQTLKTLGGYDGIFQKHGNILEVFIRNSNIRRGFKKRILDFSRLVKTGARLHPDIPGYEEVKSLVIELSADLEVLQNSEVYSKYSTEAKKKHKDLFKLDLKLEKDSKWRFRVLKDLDPYHFKVGADTNCCQSLGGVGAAAAIDSFTNSLAGVVVLEIQTQMGWKTVSQSYFHYVPEDNGYILDNVETNRKNKAIFEETFGLTLDSAYAILGQKLKKDGVEYFRCGKGYNKLDSNDWKTSSLKGGDPRRFAVSKRYTDFSASSCLDLFQPKFKVEL